MYINEMTTQKFGLTKKVRRKKSIFQKERKINLRQFYFLNKKYKNLIIFLEMK